MGIDRGQREAAQALQLPGRVAVEILGAEVEEGQREQGQKDPGQPVAHHQQRPQQVEDHGQQDVEDEGQAVIHAVQVGGEAVEDAARRGGVEEGQGGLREGGRSQQLEPRRPAAFCSKLGGHQGVSPEGPGPGGGRGCVWQHRWFRRRRGRLGRR